MLEHLENRQMLSVALNDGWTVVTPDAGAKVVYVSSSGGSDGNTGLSAAAPVKTIAKGRSLLRNGTGDQLLLKRGDTWTETLGYWKLSGKDQNNPLVIGAYGEGNRPVLANGTTNAFGGGSSTKLHDIVVQGIDFYAAQRDPSNPLYDPTAKFDGIYLAGNFENLLFENISIEYYWNNFVVSDYFGPAKNFQVRRSNISDAYSDYKTHSQGMYLEGVDGILLEENTFDHNGWNEQVSNAGATIFNHNVYVQGLSSGLVARGNIFANASSHGLQARPGGVVENNLFLNNPIGLSYGLVNGSGPLVKGGVAGVVKDNVFVGGNNIGSEVRGLGMEMANTAKGANVSVEKNIFTQSYSEGVFAAINLSYGNNQNNPQDAVGLNDLTVKDNIAYKWYRGLYVNPAMTAGGSGQKSVNNLTLDNNDYQETTSSNLVYHGIGILSGVETVKNNRYYTSNASGAPFYLAGRTYTMAAWTGSVEPTGTGVKANYVDPERTVKTYSFTLGGNGTNEDFMAKARGNEQVGWNATFTAAAANAYIRAGFVDRGDPTPAIPPGYTSVPSDIPGTIVIPPTTDTGSDNGGNTTSPPPPTSPPPTGGNTTPVDTGDPTGVPPTLPPPPPPPASNPTPNNNPPGGYTVVVGPDGKVTIVYNNPNSVGTIPNVVYVPSDPGTSPVFGGGYWYSS